MVKPIKNRKNKSRKSRPRQTRRRLLMYPPMIPFNMCFLNVVLRHVINYDKQAINSRIDKAVSMEELFSSPWSHLREVFSQVKVKKIHVYVSALTSYSERGMHAINVAPKSEFNLSDKLTFSLLMSTPGTRAGRLTQLVSGVWFPTGTDERLWFSTTSKASLMDFTYMATGQLSGGTATATYPVEITIDAHVKLRGINYSGLAIRESMELDSEFVNLATR